jgi:hypothetical protein
MGPTREQTQANLRKRAVASTWVFFIAPLSGKQLSLSGIKQPQFRLEIVTRIYTTRYSPWKQKHKSNQYRD